MRFAAVDLVDFGSRNLGGFDVEVVESAGDSIVVRLDS